MKKRIESGSQQKVLWLVLAVLTIIRMGFFTRAPYFYEPYSGYDDSNLLQLADSLLHTGWMGAYSYVTLIKGVSFPLFIVIANWLYMPYGFALGLYYVLSAGVFCRALYKIVRRSWLAAVCYLWLIYSPISFGHISSRVYRNAILFPAVVHTAGCLLMAYDLRGERLACQLPWVLWSGLSFAFFYYIREDSMWMLPLMAACMVICAVWTLWFSGWKRQTAAIRCLVYLIPICVFLLSNVGYKAVNRHFYGVGVINDRVGGAFARLMGNIMRVRDVEKTDRNIWISENQLEQVVDACPSLSADKQMYMDAYRSWARSDGVPGDHSVWAFREALNALGYYDSAQTVEEFCAQANRELMEAVKSGVLAFEPAIYFTTRSRGVYPEEIPGFLVKSMKNLFDVVTFKDTNFSLYATGEPTDESRWMQALTGVQTLIQSGYGTHISGWLILKDEAVGDVRLQVTDGEGNLLADDIVLAARGDVASAYPEFFRAGESGFSVWLDNAVNPRSCMLRVVSAADGALIKTLALDDSYEDSDVMMHIDVSSDNVAYDFYTAYSHRYARAVPMLITAMRIVSIVLSMITVILAAWFWLRLIKRPCWAHFEPAIVLTGFLLSALLLEFGVTMFNSWLALEWFYSAGAAAMGQMCQALAIFYFAKTLDDDGARRICAVRIA